MSKDLITLTLACNLHLSHAPIELRRYVCDTFQKQYGDKLSYDQASSFMKTYVDTHPAIISYNEKVSKIFENLPITEETEDDIVWLEENDEQKSFKTSRL